MLLAAYLVLVYSISEERFWCLPTWTFRSSEVNQRDIRKQSRLQTACHVWGCQRDVFEVFASLSIPEYIHLIFHAPNIGIARSAIRVLYLWNNYFWTVLWHGGILFLGQKWLAVIVMTFSTLLVKLCILILEPTSSYSIVGGEYHLVTCRLDIIVLKGSHVNRSTYATILVIAQDIAVKVYKIFTGRQLVDMRQFTCQGINVL